MSIKTKFLLIAVGVVFVFGFASVAKSYQAQINELRSDLTTMANSYREALQRANTLGTELEFCQIKAKLFDALQRK